MGLQKIQNLRIKLKLFFTDPFTISSTHYYALKLDIFHQYIFETWELQNLRIHLKTFFFMSLPGSYSEITDYTEFAKKNSLVILGITVIIEFAN